MSDTRRRVSVWPHRIAVCELEDLPMPIVPPEDAVLWSWSRCAGQHTLICVLGDEPPVVMRRSSVWRALVLRGPFDFDAVGVLHAMLTPLAGANVPVLTLSTYDSDIVLVKDEDLSRAEACLREAGYLLERPVAVPNRDR